MGAGASVEPETVIAKATENLAANPDNRACKHLLALKASGKLDEVRGLSRATRHHHSPSLLFTTPTHRHNTPSLVVAAFGRTEDELVPLRKDWP